VSLSCRPRPGDGANPSRGEISGPLATEKHVESAIAAPEKRAGSANGCAAVCLTLPVLSGRKCAKSKTKAFAHGHFLVCRPRQDALLDARGVGDLSSSREA